MIEFLIRRTDGEWFDFPKAKFAQALRPVTIACRSIEGWGDWRIEVEATEVAFSFEDPGIQVSFEGPIAEERAEQVVTEVVENIAATTGQLGTVVAL